MFDDFKLPKIREFEDLIKTPYEKTGIFDRDKAKYIYPTAKTDNPNMLCPYTLRDGEDYLEPGYYEVALSDDKRYLLLIQSRELKGLVPAIRVVVQKRSKDFENRAAEIEKEIKDKKKKNRSTRKLESELADIKELELSAKITDSKQGYYIIEYKKNNVYAWGYVPY